MELSRFGAVMLLGVQQWRFPGLGGDVPEQYYSLIEEAALFDPGYV